MSGPLLGAVVIEPVPAENLPLILAGVVALLYWRGGRRLRAARGAIAPERRREVRLRSISFLCGLVVLVLALQQPMDSYADRLLWVHMVQHVLLLTVVPPLVLLGAPWMRIWRGLPLAARRPIARWALRGRTAAPLRGLSRALTVPLVAWFALALDVVGWHLPAAYDATVHSNVVHYTEHATFLLFATIGWGRVIDSAPFRSPLSYPWRLAFSVASMVASWALALTLAFATSPFYAAYADARRSGINPLTDQHLAGGIMWVPGSLTWSLAIFILLYRWLWPLAPVERGDAPAPALLPAGPAPVAPAGGVEHAIPGAREHVPA